MSDSRLLLIVRTFKAGSDEIEAEKKIDHAVGKDRIWLGKHTFWAVRNGRGIEIEPETAS